MTYAEDDDAVLSRYEWTEFLENSPELDVPAGRLDHNRTPVILSDRVYLMEVKFWDLLTSRRQRINLSKG
jgi:hypothetical protein